MKQKLDKKATKRQKILLMGDKFIGPEPTNETIKTRLDVIHACNWYNYAVTQKDCVNWILDYMKTNKYSSREIALYKTLPEWRTSRTAAAFCRMLSNNVEFINDKSMYVDESIKKALSYVVTKEKVIKESSLTAEDKARDRLNNIIGNVEEQIDLFIKNGYVTTFDPYKYFQSAELKPIQAKQIIDFYQPLKDELSYAIMGGDAQVKEAYDRTKMADRKKYNTFILKIISDAMAFVEAKKAQRKPRKIKEKSSQQLTSKMKFGKESSQYKLVSIDPSKIIKAQSLIVFNTKYKKLGVYIAADSNGLSVKGSAITGYDETKSVSKTLRKPEDILPQVQSLGKLAFNKLFNGTKTSASKLNGRINEDTILVRTM
jgi:hypothetical protein